MSKIEKIEGECAKRIEEVDSSDAAAKHDKYSENDDPAFAAGVDADAFLKAVRENHDLVDILKTQS